MKLMSWIPDWMAYWAGTFLLSCHLWDASGQPGMTMNIEIDYMVESGTGGHSHKPQPAEVAAVVQMFACHGYTLNIVVDDELPHVDTMPRDPLNSYNFFEYSGPNGFQYFKNRYFDHDGELGWHYCIFGHQYANEDGSTSGSSGLSELNGDDFVVTLGGFSPLIGTPWERAATLAHEFGHNLGLEHGLFGNYPVNRPSIMSYFSQMRGVRAALLDHGLTSEVVSLFKEMDFSDGHMCPLNEASLDEDFGTGMVPVDWDCNGHVNGTVSMSLDDANEWCNSTDSSRTVITDLNEWANIHDSTWTLPAKRAAVRVISCITSEEVRLFELRRGVKVQPPAISEACITARMIYLTPDALDSGIGTCANPFTRIATAVANATTGSHLFLHPGTYSHHTGTLIISNKPLELFCEIGTAIIRPSAP